MKTYNIGIFIVNVSPSSVLVRDMKHGTVFEKTGNFDVSYLTASEAILEACNSEMKHDENSFAVDFGR